MSEVNTGGPAFPETRVVLEQQQGGVHAVKTYLPGLTLRDYFAGQAMQGNLATGVMDKCWASNFYKLPDDELTDKLFKMVAMTAYMHADAMLKERDEEGAA